jgi:hypothetical protein
MGHNKFGKPPAPVVFKHRRLSAAEQQEEDVALVTDWILHEMVQTRVEALKSTGEWALPCAN